jgi:hypothetical protein
MPNKTTRITITCFDGEYEFQLSIAGMVAIEEKTNCRIGAIYGLIMRGRFNNGERDFGVPAEGAFSVGMLLEVVRQGLITGNKGRSDGKEFDVPPLKANMLISRYLDPDNGNSLMEAWGIAAAVIHAAIEGVDVPDPDAKDAKPKKHKPGETVAS